jgi:hypothetical protein
VHLILGSAPRYLLRSLIKMLRMAFMTIRENLKKAPDGDPTKEHWRRLHVNFAAHSVYTLLYRITALDAYFADVDRAVRECYTKAQASPAQRAAVERAVLFRCELPELLAPAIAAAIKGAAGPLLAEDEGVDRGALYRQSIALLGIASEDARISQGEPVVDAVRKWPMGAAKKVKRCARCGSVTEDAEAAARSPAWLVSSLRHCVCFNNWIVLEEAGLKK